MMILHYFILISGAQRPPVAFISGGDGPLQGLPGRFRRIVQRFPQSLTVLRRLVRQPVPELFRPPAPGSLRNLAPLVVIRATLRPL